MEFIGAKVKASSMLHIPKIKGRQAVVAISDKGLIQLIVEIDKQVKWVNLEIHVDKVQQIKEWSMLSYGSLNVYIREDRGAFIYGTRLTDEGKEVEITKQDIERRYQEED